MKRFVLSAAASAVALLFSSAAHADTYFNFSFTGTAIVSGPGSLFSGSGVFDTVAAATPGEYLIKGVSGTADGSMITGVLAVGSFPTGLGQTANDNILIYPPAGFFHGVYFTDGGVSFSLADGEVVNLNDTVLENAVQGPRPYTTELDTVTVTPAPTPEPGSFALLATGALGIAGTVRRRLFA